MNTKGKQSRTRSIGSVLLLAALFGNFFSTPQASDARPRKEGGILGEGITLSCADITLMDAPGEEFRREAEPGDIWVPIPSIEIIGGLDPETNKIDVAEVYLRRRMLFMCQVRARVFSYTIYSEVNFFLESSWSIRCKGDALETGHAWIRLRYFPKSARAQLERDVRTLKRGYEEDMFDELSGC
ncbi:MAG: hypothetical protein LBI20_00875 [Holosporales bacterium]|jgi:hypothetical protein|nr:hypothetical protein [Holosporales bacterium]